MSARHRTWIALTPDNKLLLVAVYGENRLAFVDTSSQTVVAAIAVPKPHTVAISPDGKLAYVTAQEPGHFEIDLIDLNKRRQWFARYRSRRHRATGSSLTTASCSTLPWPASTRFEVLDPASDKIVAEIPTWRIAAHRRLTIRAATAVRGRSRAGARRSCRLFDPATNKPRRAAWRWANSRTGSATVRRRQNGVRNQ